MAENERTYEYVEVSSRLIAVQYETRALTVTHVKRTLPMLLFITGFQSCQSHATRMMRDLPRFGHSANFAYLVGSREQAEDYLYGLLFAGIFLITFFAVWTIMIIVFKCLGQEKVGFFSGSAMKVPHGSKRPRRVRIAFLVSSVVLVVFSLLLVTKGLTQIKTGVGNVYESAMVRTLYSKKGETLRAVCELVIHHSGLVYSMPRTLIGTLGKLKS